MKITLKELRKALLSNKDDTSNVIAQLGELYEKVKNLEDEINILTRLRKRTRIISYIELGIGISCLAVGCLPIWNDDQKNIQNLLIGVGSTAAATGVCTFIFTIPF